MKQTKQETKREQPLKRKHVPQRTCIACREVAGKRGLVRLVRTPEGVAIDATGKRAGRGAYLHEQRACWARALEGNLIARALRTKIDAETRQQLQAFYEALPADGPNR